MLEECFPNQFHQSKSVSATDLGKTQEIPKDLKTRKQTENNKELITKKRTKEHMDRITRGSSPSPRPIKKRTTKTSEQLVMGFALSSKVHQFRSLQNDTSLNKKKDNKRNQSTQVVC